MHNKGEKESGKASTQREDVGEAESLSTGPRSNPLALLTQGDDCASKLHIPPKGHVELVWYLKWGFGLWWCSEH